jgi:hypothetical protein
MSCQTDFEEKVGDKLGRHLKDSEEQIQALLEGISSGLKKMRRHMKAERRCIEAILHDLEATSREFETHLPAVEARKTLRGSAISGTSTDMIKPQTFNGSTSWAILHREFEAVSNKYK